MWEIGNVWSHEAGKSNATPMAASSSPSYLSVMHEIHVLLVDHDSDCLVATAKLLELYQYRVTVAELASGAIQVLSIGKAKIDLIMANVNSPDLQLIKLMQLATSLDIPVILMSGDENPFTALRAIESGAYLYVQKPATKETIKSLWQHIVRDKLVRSMRSERERLMAANYNMRGIEFRNNVGGHMLNLNNNMLPMDNGTLKNGNYTTGRRGIGEDDYESENHMLGSKIKRKVCTEWTQELHEKFMDAVQQLGEGRCFPKEILELMNVPGLTRMQVASHLQKCRNDNWRSPEERKSSSTTQHAPSDPDSAAPHKPRRFGSMPKLGSKAAATASKESSGGGNPGEGSKGPQSETETPNGDGVESMESDEPSAVVTNNNSDGNSNNNNNNPPPFHHHQAAFRAMIPTPSVNMGPPPPAAVVAIPRIASEVDFFNFTDMDCLVQNYSGLGQASAVVGLSNIASSSNGGYHFDPLYHHELQNSTMASVDNRSQWSSETTSNFGSDRDSETRGH